MNPGNWMNLVDLQLAPLQFASPHSEFHRHFVSALRLNFFDWLVPDIDSHCQSINWKTIQQLNERLQINRPFCLTFSCAPVDIGEIDWLLSSIDVKFATAIDVSSCVIVVVETSLHASMPWANVFSILKNNSRRCFFYVKRKTVIRLALQHKKPIPLCLHVPMREYWPPNHESIWSKDDPLLAVLYCLYENVGLSTSCVAPSFSIDHRSTCKMEIDPLKKKRKNK